MSFLQGEISFDPAADAPGAVWDWNSADGFSDRAREKV